MLAQSTGRTSLTKFKDPLRVPPILRLYKTDDQRYHLRIHMRPAQIQLHSELPSSEVWSYEGSLPGPFIEVGRGQYVQIEVYAGLAGFYVIRDAEEEVLGLPAGPYEIPLLLQDRNLDTAPDGSLTGRLLHKVEDGTVEFFGPFTLVNGTIWPHLPVEARQYRLRLLIHLPLNWIKIGHFKKDRAGC